MIQKNILPLAMPGVEFVSSTIDASTMDYYHVDIWTPDATTFGIKLVDFGADGAYAGGDDTESQIDFIPTKGGWISYDIKLSDFTGLASKAHLAQMLFLGSNSTLYVENLFFYNSVLPVNLLDFTVSRKGNTAILQWSTGSEQNNKGFAIERSSDASNRKEISFIPGNNRDTAISSYSATDFAPASGINYYRLKQVDFDGRTAFYSPTQSLDFVNNNAGKLVVFPNPVKYKFSVVLGAIQSKAVQYSIISTDGKVVKGGSFDKSLSNSVQIINVNSLQRGLYIIRLSDGVSNKSAKLILE